jgi:hypothetical protein
VRHVAVQRPAEDDLDQLVELGRALDGEGDRTGRDDLLLDALAGEVLVPLDAIGSHDGQEHVVRDAGAPFCVEDVAGRGGEPRPRLVALGRLDVGRVDDGGGARQRLFEPGAGEDVHPEGTGDGDGVMPGAAESFESVAAGRAGGADDCDAHEGSLLHGEDESPGKSVTREVTRARRGGRPCFVRRSLA